VTHPFHPLSGRDFEFVELRQNWGEDRVYLRGEDGELFSLLAGWTDARAVDPFTVIADGRCPFTTRWPARPGRSDRPASRAARRRARCQGDYAMNVREVTPGRSSWPVSLMMILRTLTTIIHG
jgi:hypothetical protein